MTLHQLERELDNAVSDGELFARNQIGAAVSYLVTALNRDHVDICDLLDEILSEYPERPRLFVIAGKK